MSNPIELARQAETLDDQQWFEFLDALDDVSRRRRQQRPGLDQPADLTRDGVAEWVARKHFIADRSIREISYLPHNAPDDEIRLVEVSDFLAPPDEPRLGAVDFGLDVEGCEFRLFIVDAASEQMEKIRNGTLALPEGWVLDGSTTWRRNA